MTCKRTKLCLQKREDSSSSHHCCVPLCTGSARCNSYLSFHTFPKDKDLQKRWLENIKRDRFTVTNSSRVCSRHFLSVDVIEPPTPAGRQRLRPGAVPVLFHWNSYHLPTQPHGVWERTERPTETQADLPEDEDPTAVCRSAQQAVATSGSMSVKGTDAVQTQHISKAVRPSSMAQSLRKYCSVPCCSNNKKQFPYLGFHDFPADTQLRARWVDAIRRDEGPDFKILRGSTYICSLHFTQEEKYVSARGRNKVKKGAVPSRFPWNNWGKGGSLDVQQPCNDGARKKRLRVADHFKLPASDSSTEDESSAALQDHNYARHPPPVGTITEGSGRTQPTVGPLSLVGSTVKGEDRPPGEAEGPQLSPADPGASTSGIQRTQVKTEPGLEESEQESNQDGKGNDPRSKRIFGGQAQSKKKLRATEITPMSWLAKSFLELFNRADDGVLDLRKVSQELGVPRRRIYDIANVLKGIGVIRKKSLNLIQWSYTPAIPETHEGLADLVTEEKKLDELIQTCTRQMHQLCRGERYAYVTHEDINKSHILKDQTVMLIQAAPKTKLQVSMKNHQIHVRSTTEPINVFLCSDKLYPSGNDRQFPSS